jgi:hypothetical protein
MPTTCQQTPSRKLAALALSLTLSGCPNENACPPCYIDYYPATKSMVYLQVATEYTAFAVVRAEIVLEDGRGGVEFNELDLSKIILDGQLREYSMPELDLVGDKAGSEGRRPTKAWIDIDFKQDGEVFTVRSPLSFGRPS